MHDCKRLIQQTFSKCLLNERTQHCMNNWTPFHHGSQSCPLPHATPWQTWELALSITTETLFTMQGQGRRWGGQHRACRTLLLLPSPDDDHATGVTGGQQALVAVEADVKHRRTVALQLVDSSLGCSLHIKEVHAHVLTACHCLGERERPSG